MSMIPQNQFVTADAATELMPSTTFFIDFNTKRIKRMTDSAEAVAQSAMCELLTHRYAHVIFSWQYGSELHTLYGKTEEYVFTEAKRMIVDALTSDARILEVKNFALSDGIIKFTMVSIFGESEMSVEVPYVRN